MKKQLILITAALVFSVLFYRQEIGLNLVLFTILSILVSYSLSRKKWDANTWLITLLYIVSSIPVFLFTNTLAILVNISCLFLFLGKINENRSSLFVQLMNGLYTLFTSFFNHQYDRYLHPRRSEVDFQYWGKLIGIPIVFVAIFIVLYQLASEDFYNFIQHIDLSFLNFQWLIFTCLGYIVLFNCSDPIALTRLTKIDLYAGNSLDSQSVKSQNPSMLAQENQLGTVLIGMLNCLLVIFILILFKSLLSSEALSPSDLSKSVHEGIYALIASILLAIGIILYFFRGSLNFYSKNRALKTLTLSWIVLNVFLIGITAYKNYCYVSFHGLTYKRIGVFIYLLLALSGLIFTFIKVRKKRNLWYLARLNSKVAFVLLIVCSFIPWDNFITYFNIYKANHTDVDYLLHLSPHTIFQLKAQEANFSPQIRMKIDLKYKDHKKLLAQKNWQEYSVHNLKISSNETD